MFVKTTTLKVYIPINSDFLSTKIPVLTGNLQNCVLNKLKKIIQSVHIMYIIGQYSFASKVFPNPFSVIVQVYKNKVTF